MLYETGDNATFEINQRERVPNIVINGFGNFRTANK